MYHPTQDPQHFDTFDEWLARVICYCFSLPPTAFVRQMNRATAQTATEQSLKEGQEPIKRWIKALHDFLLSKFCQAPELEFMWQEEEEIDPLAQAQIYALYRQNNVMTDDEVRGALGMEPKTPEQRQMEAPETAPDKEPEQETA